MPHIFVTKHSKPLVQWKYDGMSKHTTFWQILFLVNISHISLLC